MGTTKIGVDNLVYAIMTDEGDKTTAPTYDSITAAPGVISLGINANASQETLFYDNGPGETAGTLGNIEVEIQKNQLSLAEKADLLGHGIDTKGGLVYGAADTPSWVAIGFKSLKSNGKHKYVWLYKGKFMEPEDSNETKGDNINFQTETIKGQFVKIDQEVTAGGITSKPWKYEIDEEHSTADATTISNWFSAVTMPTADA